MNISALGTLLTVLLLLFTSDLLDMGRGELDHMH